MIQAKTLSGGSPEHLLLPRAEHPLLQSIVEYLDRLAEQGPVSRGRIRPEELKPYLRHLTLIDVLPDEADFRCRLCGTGAAEAFQQDFTGKRFSQLPELAQKAWLSLFDLLLQRREPIYFRRGMNEFHQSHKYYESFIYPLFSADGEINMFFTAGAKIVLKQPGNLHDVEFHFDI